MSGEAENGLITRSAEPLNLEMPFSALKEALTPNEQFYVRCHFPVPEIDRASWRLRVEGGTAGAMALSYEELCALPRQTIQATMECAGNGRSFLEPKVKGVQWDLGAVGNAGWSGVRLRDVLERAGLPAGAREIILEGADKGEIKEAPKPAGEIHYARSLPLNKALDDVLLVLEMNGEPLTPAHGFPVRALVPGWFGMASVKWLQRVIISQVPFQGYYQTIDYTYWRQVDGLATLEPLAEMRLKAQIARPAMNEVLRRETSYRIHGAAWTGEDEIAAVEISTDGGASWLNAKLLGEPVRNSWRLWELNWKTPSVPGRHVLIARARNSSGKTQPAERNADYGSYMIDHWLPISVEVR